MQHCEHRLFEVALVCALTVGVQYGSLGVLAVNPLILLVRKCTQSKKHVVEAVLITPAKKAKPRILVFLDSRSFLIPPSFYNGFLPVFYWRTKQGSAPLYNGTCSFTGLALHSTATL